MLSNTLGVGSNSLRNKVNAFNLIIPCSKCGESTIHPVKNKSQLAEKKSFARNNPILCDECIASELERVRPESRNKKEKQETNRKNKITELQAMPYEEYLKTDHWKRVKKSALSRVDYRCTKCGRKNVQLDVHHLTYGHKGYEYPQDLKVVCRPCHERIHGRKFNA